MNIKTNKIKARFNTLKPGDVFKINSEDNIESVLIKLPGEIRFISSYVDTSNWETGDYNSMYLLNCRPIFIDGEVLVDLINGSFIEE